MKMIQSLSCRHDQSNDENYAVVRSLKGMLYFYQRPKMTNDEYLKDFKRRVELFEDNNACILGKFPSYSNTGKKMLDKNVQEATESEVTKCKDVVKKEVIAAMFIHGTNKFRYGSLKSTLAQLSMGTSQ